MNYIDPYKFWDKLNECSHYSVVTANGMASVTAHQVLRVKKGQRLITNAGLGHMGSGLPLAIGACVASGKPIVCATGDGSIMFNLQELQTIKHHKLPIKIFIFNNGGYWSIRNTHKHYFGKPFACDPKTGVSFPDFKKVAKAFGIRYEPNIKKAINSTGPVICELMIDPNQKLKPKWTAGKYRQ